MKEKNSYIGRMLSANSKECVVSALTPQNEIPAFGSMLRIPTGEGQPEIYGVVTDVTLEEDGFLRQIAGSADISEEVIRDAQENRNVPIVIRTAFIGYMEGDRVLHLLPPRPPVTLTEIYPCSPREICEFTRKLGYLRFLIDIANLPAGELLAVHLRQAAEAHVQMGDTTWAQRAVEEIMELLSGTPDGLIAVIGAIGDADIFTNEE
ncbi:MAG: hypothetical protein II969_06480 [Anaerolineaceae bacterium]|nr:hypothetical protein [Anaerolineaceae bacterium]